MTTAQPRPEPGIGAVRGFWGRCWDRRPGLWDGAVVIACTTIATGWLGIPVLIALGAFTGLLAVMAAVAAATGPAAGARDPRNGADNPGGPGRAGCADG